jgi:uncharacterized Zn-binding protein involved in type VI secretion
MPGILRQNLDKTVDNALIIEGSPNVFINGHGAVRVGDNIQPHQHGKTTVYSYMITGSSTVFVNGKSVCRSGDQATNGDVAGSGSPNCIAG